MRKYGFFSALRDLFRYAKDNKKEYSLGIIFMLIYVVTAMLYTTMNSNLIANIMSLNLDKAINLVIICALLRIFSITFCHNQHHKLMISAGEKITATIQKKIYKKVLTLTMNSFESINTGKIYTTIKAADISMMSTITTLFRESTFVFTSFVMLIIIYIIDFKIGLAITFISFISLYLFKIQLDKSEIYLNREFTYSDNYLSLVGETTKGIREIKSLGLKKKCEMIFNDNIDNLKNERTSRRLLRKNVNTAKWTIRIIGDAIILLYIINKVKLQIFDVETAMLIITYMTTIIDDVFHRIIEHDFGISEFTANMKRIKWLLEENDLTEEKFGENNYTDILGTIEFKDVSFKYNEKDKEALHNINFKIEPNSKTAVIGMSGGGKTTIFKLLLKQYDNYKGKILIDNKDIKNFTEKSLRNSITVVNQEPILFNMSIKENLLMVNDQATDEEIKKACKLANIDTFIESLPNKYDEILEENGMNISVGQKQRIAIARAILKDTPIILFDEATSALDKKSKREIEKTINELAKKKCVVVILHSLENIKDYDNILVIKEGKLIEKGDENELLEKKGYFYTLNNLQ